MADHGMLTHKDRSGGRQQWQRTGICKDAPRPHADEHLGLPCIPRSGSRKNSDLGDQRERRAVAEAAQEHEGAAGVALGEEGEAGTNHGSRVTGTIYPPPPDTDYASTSCCAGC